MKVKVNQICSHYVLTKVFRPVKNYLEKYLAIIRVIFQIFFQFNEAFSLPYLKQFLNTYPLFSDLIVKISF